jgi:hypothetical protein
MPSPSTNLTLAANLTLVSGQVTLEVSSRDNELFINIPSFEGMKGLMGSFPESNVLRPLQELIQQSPLATLPCHVQLTQKTILTFPLGKAPLNFQEILVKYFNSLLS